MITGKMLRDAIISASNNIGNNRKSVDELNVFPVPDGDTGTNMAMTIGSAAREASMLDADTPVGAVADTVASALLRGARGNSGVILSLIFRGFARGLKGMTEAGGEAVAQALMLGVEAAYKAVMKPTEGTILTVVRMAAESAGGMADKSDVRMVWDTICLSAEAALRQTPDMLPVLKTAGVVDAGGQGFLLILRGMQSVFDDDTIIPSDGTSALETAAPKSIVAAASDDIKYGYCSEFLINRSTQDSTSTVRLRAYLESIGDCVVVVEDANLIKVHCHSNEPGNVLQAALKYGPLINIKIDNMRHQHSNAAWGADSGALSPEQEERKPFGFVAVAAGEGLKQLFSEIGVDRIVSGGQTMNPSTEDILSAISSVPAEHVFVLPNNKNIIMAAEQAIPLADRRVSVLQTRTIPQGITAMLNFDESLPAEENHLAMMKAAERVSTGLVTFAARDSQVDGQKVHEGQILGMENGKITVIESDPVKAAFRITKHLFKKGCSLISILYGEQASEEQANALQAQLQAKFSEAEISVIDGGQPVYYFTISVE